MCGRVVRESADNCGRSAPDLRIRCPDKTSAQSLVSSRLAPFVDGTPSPCAGVDVGEAMRSFRGKTITRKIAALLLVPLVSLTAMWAFATYLTGREANQLLGVGNVVAKLGYPAEDAVQALQQERRQSLVFLADRRGANSLAALRERTRETDKVVAKLRDNADDPAVRDDLDGIAGARMDDIVRGLNRLSSLRARIEDNTISRDAAFEAYNDLVDPNYEFLAALHALENVEMDKQGRALVNVTRAREAVAREDALMSAALVSGTMDKEGLRAFSDRVAERRVLYDTSLPLLPGEERSTFADYWRSAPGVELTSYETHHRRRPAAAPRAVNAERWNSAAGKVLGDLQRMGREAGDRYKERVEPVAIERPAQGRRRGRPRLRRPAGLGHRLRPHRQQARTGPDPAAQGRPRGLRRPAAQRHAPPGRRRTGRRRGRGAAPGVRPERDRAGRPGAQHPPAGRRRGRRQAGRHAPRRLRGLRQPRPPQPGPAAPPADPAGRHGTAHRERRGTGRPVPPRPPHHPHAAARRGPGDPLRRRPLAAVAQAHPADGRGARGGRRGGGLRAHRGAPAAAAGRPGPRGLRPHPPDRRTPGERHRLLAPAHRGPGGRRAGLQRLHPGDPRPGPGHGPRRAPRRQPAARRNPRVRTVRHRPARPVRGQPPRPAPGRTGLAPALPVRRAPPPSSSSPPPC
ncbi:hypothetical protein SRIMM317S_05475 [Streptomyces rimosus subsp. rimosus]